MVDPKGHVFWTVILYTWPYACIPLAFSIDRKLRARWLLEDVSRPASGYRFKGANMQMVVTSRVEEGGGKPLQQQAHGRSRWLECTNLWWLAVVGPGVFIFAAELSSGVMSVLLVCTPFVCLTLFALSLNQVTILVSLLASPVVSLLYGVVNRGPGDSLIRSLLWSQAFIALTAVSLAWSVHGVIRLRTIIAAAAAADAAAVVADTGDAGACGVDGKIALKDDDNDVDQRFPLQNQQRVQEQTKTPVNLSPETCIIKAAEAILSGHTGCVADEDVALATLVSTVRQVRRHGLTVDTPVLQTANSLHAWTKVISHQGEVERDIRETDRWGVLEEKLISMNAGMPSMVGIIQVILLATSQLEDSDAFGSDPDGTTFYCSLIPFAASIVVSAVLLARMLALIHRAAQGLAAAAKKTDTAMETFVDLRSWGILRHGEVGCLTHIAASRGMVRALDFLVRNGANLSSVDSTGQTPLQIAEQFNMAEARDYLEARINSGGSRQTGADGSGGLIPSPLAERLRKKVSLARSPRSPEGRKVSGDGATEDEGGNDSGSPVPVYGWRQVQKVARAAVRWVSKSEQVLARRRRARVSAEPQATFSHSTETAAAAATAAVGAAAAGASDGGTPSTPAELLLLPPALPISCRPCDSHDGQGGLRGSVETSAVPSLSSCSSPESKDGRNLCGKRGGISGEVDISPSARMRGVCSPPAEEDANREEKVGVCSGEEAALPTQGRVRRRPSGMPPDDNADVKWGSEATTSRLLSSAATESVRRASWKKAEGNKSEKGSGGVEEGGKAVAGREAVRKDETAERKDDAGDSGQDDQARDRSGNGSNASENGKNIWKTGASAERKPSSMGCHTSGLPESLSATRPEDVPPQFSNGDPSEGKNGAVDAPPRSDAHLAATVMEALSRPSPTRAPASFRRRRESTRSTSTPKTSPVDTGANITYSPTQAVLNITWALRRLRPLGTPQERRAAFEGLRNSSPVHIPQMYLLAFLDLAVLGEIPRRTGERFLGHASKKPVKLCELVARAQEPGEGPVVVYVSHRWLEPDFKNPDDHSKTRFYQVCFVVQRLAKRMGRKPCEFYLWIDYACINQQNPAADRLALPYVLDACDFMVYIEDDEYWDQALARTEHFLFRKLRRLRPPAKGTNLYEEDVFSLSADGERLTQRSYAETNARFTHNPAKGSLTTETDRLYLWTLVLALEYEDNYTSFAANLGPQEETGFMKLLREAVFVNACADPKRAAAELAARDAKLHADAAAAAAAAAMAAAEAAMPDQGGEEEEAGGEEDPEMTQQDGKGETGGDGVKAMETSLPTEEVDPTDAAGAGGSGSGSGSGDVSFSDGHRAKSSADGRLDDADGYDQESILEAEQGDAAPNSGGLDLGFRDDGGTAVGNLVSRPSESGLGGVGCEERNESAPVVALSAIDRVGVGGDIETGEGVL